MLMPALAERPPRDRRASPASATGTRWTPSTAPCAFAPYAGLFNVTGQPAIVVPAGFGADGLPSAVQLVGRPLAEDTLLQVARQLEVAAPVGARAPALAPAPAPIGQRVDAERLGVGRPARR